MLKHEVIEEYNKAKKNITEQYNVNKHIPGAKAWYDRQIAELDHYLKEQSANWIDTEEK